MAEAVIIDAVRTAIGRNKGALRDTRPDQLLAHALEGLVKRTGVDKAKIEDVIIGCVGQVGEQGMNIARRTALLAGFPIEVPGVTLNRFCSSAQQSIHFAAQAIVAGDADYIIAGGVESLTRVPMGSDGAGVWPKIYEAMKEHHDLAHQGISAEMIADKWSLTRADVDGFSTESHRRAFAAIKEQRHKEILPTPGVDAEGKNISLTWDEGVREKIDPAKMGSLPTVFRPAGDGVVTAGNSSQISDGAAAVLVANRERAEADGFKPRAKFRARVAVGSDPTFQLTGVIPATQLALKKAGLTINDIDWFEINEAFATVVLCWERELKPDMAKVNPWGGAIAHGHPVGATGSILLAKLLTGLDAVDGQFGLQVMCAGHGMATCTIVERMK
ncbi:MAG: thiolase family protein [Acidobacteria bacterium]|nr:thiolase family protein [Acidobacteriota bacterium]MBI3422221.1 thiolase family protein [Acidobacteriota bacterium]